MLAMIGMAVFASFATYWPYNLAPSWKHYTMGFVDAEVGDAFLNSLKLAAGTAFFGTIVVFVGAYMLEKTRGLDAHARRWCACWRCCRWRCRAWCSASATSSSSTRPAIRCNGLYQTLTLLVICTIVHFYTTGHLTAVTALKSLDAEFEAVSASLKVPFFKTFWRVTLPICTPTLIDIARYFFINAMTTISAVVFLYSPETKVASIAILNLDEAGEAGAAAACAVLITAGSTVVTLLFMAVGAWVDRTTQAWRRTRRAERRPQHDDQTRRRPMERDAILLTPGPLTTTERTKRAMLRDWGSWDSTFIAVTAELRQQLLAIVHGEGTHVVVPLQGSGTFAVEAAVATIVPKDGHVLVLDNGAYCKRMGRLATLMGRRDDDPRRTPRTRRSRRAELDAALARRRRASPTSA